MKSVALSASLVFLSLSAHAYSIDFGSAGLPSACAAMSSGEGPFTVCGAGIALNQAYGDVPGVVNVTYTDVNIPTRSLLWWDTNFNNLYGVAYSSGNDGDSSARIDLEPGSGLQVTLDSFRLGAYSNQTRATNVVIYAIGEPSPLYVYAGTVGNGSIDSTLFDLDLTSASGIRIEWSDSAANVGIDQIHFTVTPVPEPGAAALAAAAASALGALARRRSA